VGVLIEPWDELASISTGDGEFHHNMVDDGRI
jgi:hypothetical protein